MARYCGDRDSSKLLEAMEQWKQTCFINDGSMLSDENIWTLSAVRELKSGFLDNPDESNRGYLEKLQDQVSNLTPKAIGLMAEIHWLLIAIQTNIKTETKIEQIKQIWSWSNLKESGSGLALSQGTLSGIVNTGTAYNTLRWAEVGDVIKIMLSMKSLPVEERKKLLDEPVKFAEWLNSVTLKGTRICRHVLRYYCFPDFFERIVVNRHKTRILETFSEHSSETIKSMSDLELDKALFNLRKRLEKESTTGNVDFYDPPYRQKWFEQTAKPEQSSNEVSESKTAYARKVWLISPGQGSKEWDDFYEAGIIAIGWDDLGDLTKFTDKNNIRECLLVDASDTSASMKNISLALWEFSRTMMVGDIVIAKKGVSEYLGFGVVDSDYYFDSNKPKYKHCRKVNWKKKGVWQETKGPIVVKTLTEISKYPDYVDRLFEMMDVEESKSHSESKNYWWMNVNPKYWRIETSEVGAEQTYTTHNESGNKRKKYEYFKQVQPGDMVIGYESTPTKKVIAEFEITKALFTDEDGCEQIAFKLNRFIPPRERASWDELRQNQALSVSEVMLSNQGSLFKLTKKEYETILSARTGAMISRYDLSDVLSEVFIEKSQIEDILDCLVTKKNVILQGPPGTGKTFFAKRLAHLLFGEKDSSRIEMVQFHQSYSYEDFIQGYRPDGTGFKLKNGVFYNFCHKAKNDPDSPYIFIIDEINRGNLSKVFGELMMLVENDKRGPQWSIPLTYSSDLEDKFYVPDNIHIVGLMNTADRSLAMVDYALRRRFAFFSIEPGFSTRSFKEHLSANNVSQSLINLIVNNMSKLNDEIANDAVNLGSGFCIGHSFFCNFPVNKAPDEVWYEQVVRREIGPLLREYWFDEPKKAESLIEDILLQ